MSSISEIEAAIENLPSKEVDELAQWLETFRFRRAAPTNIDDWVRHARGSALANVTTADVMALTRGEE